MTTCMETWIAADRGALRERFGAGLQESALPALAAMESRLRGDVQRALAHATRNCTANYTKGRISFELLAMLDPGALRQSLPSFVRFVRVLGEKFPS